jgi:uncharacterized protein (UPF0332 family)
MNEKSVRLHLQAAEEAVGLAEELYEKQHVRTAVSRSYYAMFYAATALLAAEGLAFSKHSGVISGYGQHFAKTGQLDPQYHAWLLKAFQLRNTADYALDAILTQDIVVEQLTRARAFVEAARQYLADHGKDMD